MSAVRPKIYLVKTNYDWDPTLLDEPKKESFDILGSQFNYGGYALEKRLQQYREERILPCIEFRPDHIQFHSITPLIADFQSTINYTTLCELIHLTHPAIKDPYFRTRLPPNFSYCDLLIDYDSNKKQYNKLLAKLDKNFDVQHLELRRTVDNTD